MENRNNGITMPMAVAISMGGSHPSPTPTPVDVNFAIKSDIQEVLLVSDISPESAVIIIPPPTNFSGTDVLKSVVGIEYGVLDTETGVMGLYYSNGNEEFATQHGVVRVDYIVNNDNSIGLYIYKNKDVGTLPINIKVMVAYYKPIV